MSHLDLRRAAAEEGPVAADVGWPQPEQSDSSCRTGAAAAARIA